MHGEASNKFPLKKLNKSSSLITLLFQNFHQPAYVAIRIGILEHILLLVVGQKSSQ